MAELTLPGAVADGDGAPDTRPTLSRELTRALIGAGSSSLLLDGASAAARIEVLLLELQALRRDNAMLRTAAGLPGPLSSAASFTPHQFPPFDSGAPSPMRPTNASFGDAAATVVMHDEGHDGGEPSDHGHGHLDVAPSARRRWGRVTKQTKTAASVAGKAGPAFLTRVHNEHSHNWRCKRHVSFLHDTFLSYRVAADGVFAVALADALASAVDADGNHPTVFFDQYCLNDGENWEDGFLNGLGGSACVLLLISEATFDGIKANAASRQDNVLLEWERALSRLAEGKNRVLPLFVGHGTYADVPGVDGGPATRKFTPAFRFPRIEDFPDAPHASPKSGEAVRTTVASVLKLQGVPVDAADPKHAVPAIMSFLAEFDTVVHPGQRIADGIARCRAGGRLLVRPGLYSENVVIGSEVHLYGQKQVVIDGVVTSRGGAATLDGFALRKLVIASGKLAVSSTMIVGVDADDAAVLVQRGAMPSFKKCSFLGCPGGGLRTDLSGGDGTCLKIDECDFSDCGGEAAIAVVVKPGDVDATLSLTECTFARCKVGLSVRGRAAGTRVVLSGFRASAIEAAGASIELYGGGATVEVTGATVSGCEHGISVDMRGTGGRVTVTDSIVSACAGSGIAVEGDDSSAVLARCRIVACGGTVPPAPPPGDPSASDPIWLEMRKAAGVDLRCCGTASLDDCQVDGCPTGLRLESVASSSVRGCTLRDCGFGAVVMLYASAAVEKNVFLRCACAAVTLAAGMASPAVVAGNRLEHNGAGVVAWRGASAAAVGANAEGETPPPSRPGTGVGTPLGGASPVATACRVVFPPVATPPLVTHRDELLVPLTASLDWAVAASPPGGTLLLAAGAYAQSLVLPASKAITVTAWRPGRTVLTGRPVVPGVPPRACVICPTPDTTTLDAGSPPPKLVGLVIGSFAVGVSVAPGASLSLIDCVLSGRPIAPGAPLGVGALVGAYTPDTTRVGEASTSSGGRGSLVPGPPLPPPAPAVLDCDGCAFLECSPGIRVFVGGRARLSSCRLVGCGIGIDADGGKGDSADALPELMTSVTADGGRLVAAAIAAAGAASPAVATADGCQFSLNGSAARASAGGTVSLTRCHVDGATATGQGSVLEARETTVYRGGVAVGAGAATGLTGCAFKGCGLTIAGSRAAAAVSGCQFSAHGGATADGVGGGAQPGGVHASAIMVTDGGRLSASATTFTGGANGITLSGSTTAAVVDGGSITGCGVSCVNVLKGARLDMRGTSITGAVCDGILLANQAVCTLDSVTLTACIRCGVCVLPDCRLSATNCKFDGNASAVHVGGRLARWFSRGGGCLGDSLRLIGSESCLRNIPGLCCLWRETLTTSTCRLESCTITRSGKAAVHAWMASASTLELLRCTLTSNTCGLVFAAPRGWASPGQYRGLQRRLQRGNAFRDNVDDMAVQLETYAAAADSVDKMARQRHEVAPLADFSWVEQAGYEIFVGWRRFRGLGPSGGHEDNQIYTSRIL